MLGLVTFICFLGSTRSYRSGYSNIRFGRFFTRMLSPKNEKDASEFPRFHSPFNFKDEAGSPPKTLLEKDMMAVSSEIRRKPNWNSKIHDDSIVNKWKEEASHLLQHHQFRYVIEELKYFSSLGEGSMQISPVDGVWQADHLIDGITKQKLIGEEEHPCQVNSLTIFYFNRLRVKIRRCPTKRLSSWI